MHLSYSRSSRLQKQKIWILQCKNKSVFFSVRINFWNYFSCSYSFFFYLLSSLWSWFFPLRFLSRNIFCRKKYYISYCWKINTYYIIYTAKRQIWPYMYIFSQLAIYLSLQKDLALELDRELYKIKALNGPLKWKKLHLWYKWGYLGICVHMKLFKFHFDTNAINSELWRYKVNLFQKFLHFLLQMAYFKVLFVLKNIEYIFNKD